MRSSFGSVELALLSLSGGNTVLPTPTVQVTPFEAGDRIALLGVTAISPAFVPDAPPPRL
jgi:hypothetical protein